MLDFNLVLMSISNFYTQLNDIGRLVFIIVLLLFLILIILIVIMMFQKDDKKYTLVFDDKDINDIKDGDIDENNEKTKNLKYIVDELNKARVDKTDLYEDEQEKTAIISYQELLKAAQEEKIEEPKKKPEVFSSVFGPNEVPNYEPEQPKEENKEQIDSETFLKSLKDFRSNL